MNQSKTDDTRISTYLQRFNIGLDPISNGDAVTVKAQLLSDAQGYVMAVTLKSDILDENLVRTITNRQLTLTDQATAMRHLGNSEFVDLPAFGEAFNLTTLIDRAVLGQDRLRIATGGGEWVEMTAEEYLLVHQSAPLGIQISAQKSAVDPTQTSPEIELRHSLRAEVEGQLELPVISNLAKSLVEMQNDPHAGVDALAELINLDSNLAAQIMRTAGSAYYGFKGELDSVKTAISLVIGFDDTINLALAICGFNVLRIPNEGPLGLRQYWLHSVRNATLCRQLAALVSAQDVNPETAYLCGLMHDIGIALIGHLKPEIFHQLSTHLENSDGVRLNEIEDEIIDISHSELGALLLEEWQMPEPISTAARYHHESDYSGTQSPYADLIYITDNLVDATEAEQSNALEDVKTTAVKLGLSMEDIQTELEALNRESEKTASLAAQLFSAST